MEKTGDRRGQIETIMSKEVEEQHVENCISSLSRFCFWYRKTQKRISTVTCNLI